VGKFSVFRNSLGVTAIMLCIIVGCLHAGWWRTYGGEGGDAGYCVEVTDDGGFIISGYSTSKGGHWLIKTDERGNVTWDQIYEGSNNYLGNCVHQTSDGEYVFRVGIGNLIRTDESGNVLWTKYCGFETFWMEPTFDGGCIIVGTEHVMESGDLVELWIRLLKVDSEGNTEWVRRFGESIMYNWGLCTQQTSDNGYIVLGYSGDYGKLWLLKTDTTGLVEWERMHNAWYPTFINLTSDGGYIIGVDDGLMRTDSLGDTLWTRYYGVDPYDVTSMVQQTSDGGFIVVGNYRHPDERDLWLLKTDSLGDALWQRIYGGEEKDYGSYTQQTSDGGYIVVGETRSFGAGEGDIYLLKTDSLGLVAVSEPVTPVTHPDWQVSVSVGRQIVLRAPEGAEPLNLTVFDASGRLVDEIRLASSSTISWGEGMSPGVYFIKSDGDSSKTSKIVLVK